MTKRRMAGWQPLTVDHPYATTTPPSKTPATPPQPAARLQDEPVTPTITEPVVSVEEHETPLVQDDPRVAKRRMVGWQPLAAANPAAESVAVTQETTSLEPTPAVPVDDGAPIQDSAIPRRRMAGWQPLKVAYAGASQAPAATPVAPAVGEQPPAETVVAEPAASSEEPVVVAREAAAAPVMADVPRRRMAGWAPLKVAHPGVVAAVPVAETTPPVEAEPEPVVEPVAPPAEVTPSAPRRMGTPAAAPEQPVGVNTPQPVAPAAKTAEPVETTPARGGMPKAAKVVLSLVGVAIVAVVAVLGAQWLRTLDPVAEFVGTYDGTPTHPDGVEAGIPGWVGWQHFFNFFIMVMVIRSGFLIRNQQRPEAYWTPTKGGFFSPKKTNTPAKVSIQQWIHQTFNVLWVVNGVIFYVMVFATGHWMRIVPTNWDIFPNLVSAAIQYVSLDWPADNAWVYYNALQIMTYFITVFIAAPLAIVTGLRLSTWWPQHAQRINKAFPLPVARTLHFGTMVYFILFIIVHLFLVFTTGVLTNLNMMFTARNADDWIGIAVFAGSVVITVAVAWLIKPIFISSIAEKTGTVSTR